MLDNETKTFPASVLVMDDDDSIRKLFIELLESQGYVVFTSDNGIDGMELLKKHPIDLVITDIIMPGKEGIEIVRELKRDYPEVKIIVMSGYTGIGQYDYLKYALTFGADSTFRKPFDVQEFMKTIRDLLGQKGKMSI